MKADRTGTHSAATARRVRLVDFLFVGAGVAPLALLLGGQSALGILLFIPLLFTACLCGAWEQVGAAPDGGSGPIEQPVGNPPAATGLNLRNRLKG